MCKCMEGQRWYRVWLLRGRSSPRRLESAPRRFVAVEPAEDAPMSAGQASEYAAAYNAVALSIESGLWAVAVPVTIRYEGDLRAGRPLSARVAPPASRPR